MIGRLVQKADFERALATPVRSRSAHFAVHHVAAGPTPPPRPSPRSVQNNLSTAPAPVCPQPVDDTVLGQWIGCVVPKRHARRAVTRSLLKRQIRGAFEQHASQLPVGQWLVRLRQPFARAEFTSASSDALRRAARDELDGLLARAGAAGSGGSRR
jgi:ribonuclease P protein component